MTREKAPYLCLLWDTEDVFLHVRRSLIATGFGHHTARQLHCAEMKVGGRIPSDNIEAAESILERLTAGSSDGLVKYEKKGTPMAIRYVLRKSCLQDNYVKLSARHVKYMHILQRVLANIDDRPIWDLIRTSSEAKTQLQDQNCLKRSLETESSRNQVTCIALSNCTLLGRQMVCRMFA